MQQQSTRPRARLIVRICGQCGKEFDAEARYVNRGGGRFCTLACAAANKRDTRGMTVAQFWAKVDKRGECWFWTGRPHANGYGHVVFKGRNFGAHRLAYILTNGPITRDVLVCHTCDISYAPGDISYRLCCRPDHLVAGTAAQNMQHCSELARIPTGSRHSSVLHPDRVPRGEQHGMSVLRTEQVLEIRRRYTGKRGEQIALAREYGVSTRTIADVVQRRTWDWVP